MRSRFFFLACGLLALGNGCGGELPVADGAGTGGDSAGGGGGGGSGGDPVAGPQIEGLSGPVNATYDESGILHLSCGTDEDCFASLGYFHAANRFFFMDFVRNQVRGKLASLVAAGDLILAQDYENRRFFSTAAGEPLETKIYDDASPAVQGYLDAYTRGVNAWIADMRAEKNGATLTIEYDFGLIVKENIRDWEPEDSAAVSLYVLNDLSNNSGSELSLGEELPAVMAVSPALASDMFSGRPVFDAFTEPAGNAPPPGFPLPPPRATARQAPAHGSSVAALAGHGSLLADARRRMQKVGSGSAIAAPGETGSNNWAVAPSRTSGGNAILANDPHLLLTNPSIWFAVELDAKSSGDGDIHVAGSTFPGLPAVMVGHNESIGWGVTTAYWDLADVYLEEVSADGTTVTFNGEQVPILEKDFTFDDAASGGTVTKTFRWVPHHGPIVSEEAGSAVSIRWRGHEGGTDLDAFFNLARAGSVAEGKAAVESVCSASQNFVVIDKDGSIGWFPYGRVPSRPWASAALAPWLPLPGDGSAEWGDSVPLADLPQLLDPTNGSIATANADMTGASADGDLLNDGQAALQAYDKAEGTRARRIMDLLDEGGSEHSVSTLTTMQGDTFSLYGEALTPLILDSAATAMLTPEEQAVVDALAAWHFTCPTGVDGHDPQTAPDDADATATAESIGCTAFHVTLFSIVTTATGDDIAAAGLEAGGSRWELHLVARAMKDPGTIASGNLLWDDVSTTPAVETKDETIVRGLSLAATALAALGPVNDWRWGRHHVLSLRSIYDNFGLADWNEGPYAVRGGLYTVNVANPGGHVLGDDNLVGDLGFRFGASVRFVVEATPDGPVMTYQLPGGNDLHRESDFYNNLLPNWIENTSIPFPFGPGAVENPAMEVTVNPAP
jgi:penicillin G amidase